MASGGQKPRNSNSGCLDPLGVIGFFSVSANVCGVVAARRWHRLELEDEMALLHLSSPVKVRIMRLQEYTVYCPNEIYNCQAEPPEWRCWGV